MAWYRFRTTFRHRLGGFLTIALLLGVIGGIAMGSMAAARRTDSSFSTFLASTNPSNLQLVPAPANGPNYSPAMTTLLAHLPHVRHVVEASIESVFPLGAERDSSTSPRLPTRTSSRSPASMAWASPRIGPP